MKGTKILAILMIVTLLLSMATALGAAPAKGPIVREFFVHYPKDAPGRPANPGQGGGGSGSGVLSSDFKYSRIHWGDPSEVDYYINPTLSGVDAAATVTAIQAAFVTWDNADGPLGFSYEGLTDKSAGADDDTNVISWGSISQADAIAVTYYSYYLFSKELVEVDTVMNITFSWSYTAPDIINNLSGAAVKEATRYSDPNNSGAAGKYDIQNIMTHEAGHWLVLGDLYRDKDSQLTMYGYGSTGEIKKDTLGYGDELGVESIY